jgi:polyhydroxyalkanoate synthesis repressor PhaR
MPRIIKKYANRRLYDTNISQYITLDDLKQLIVAGIAVQVIDAKSKQDISREVLLQLVSEQESLGQPILNETILTALIRFYGHPMQKLVSRYLEMALDLLHGSGQRPHPAEHGLDEPVAADFHGCHESVQAGR